MNNEVKQPVNSYHTPYFIFNNLCALLLCIAAVSSSMAQNPPPKVQPNPKAQAVPEKIDSTELKSTYIFAGIGAFIPTGQSYLQNYSTKLAGLPVEVNGGVLFPVSNSLLVPLTVRYIRRVASFIDNGSIDVFSIEPGIRFFLERQRGGDLRLFGGVSALLTQATVSGDYFVSSNGTVTGAALANPTYLDAGMGIDLGFSYPLTQNTAFDAAVHIALYFASPVSDGGLGNIGGVSLCADYRFGF